MYLYPICCVQSANCWSNLLTSRRYLCVVYLSLSPLVVLFFVFVIPLYVARNDINEWMGYLMFCLPQLDWLLYVLHNFAFMVVKMRLNAKTEKMNSSWMCAGCVFRRIVGCIIYCEWEKERLRLCALLQLVFKITFSSLKYTNKAELLSKTSRWFISIKPFMRCAPNNRNGRMECLLNMHTHTSAHMQCLVRSHITTDHRNVVTAKMRCRGANNHDGIRYVAVTDDISILHCAHAKTANRRRRTAFWIATRNKCTPTQ